MRVLFQVKYDDFITKTVPVTVQKGCTSFFGIATFFPCSPGKIIAPVNTRFEPGIL
jgi:hypothetical protein